ncbi:hypothetical protein, partial [Acinetobacter nosocomialis]|uniref:hypothetical protein n=1 Tax=Acinetobacter nosocomialis TaxID=106654 RepID=UPI001D180A49
RRWSEGLHQAVEAKEGLEIQPENQTLATTTFQNYFRLYKKLSVKLTISIKWLRSKLTLLKRQIAVCNLKLSKFRAAYNCTAF